MPADFEKLQIAGIIQETHDTRSYVLAVPESLREAFQYARLRPIPGPR